MVASHGQKAPFIMSMELKTPTIVVKIMGELPFCRKLLSGRADLQYLTLHFYQKPSNERALTSTVAQPSQHPAEAVPRALCSVCSDLRAKGAGSQGEGHKKVAVWIAQFCLLSEFVSDNI